MLLTDLLAGSVDRFPEKTALIFPDANISFRILDNQSSQIACRLRSLNIGEGDRVAILYENAPAAVAFFWGILKSGAEVVDVPHLAGTGTIERILDECRPAALVTSERQLHRLLAAGGYSLPRIVFAEVPQSVPGRECHALRDIVAEEVPESVTPRVRETDVALIVYTSGTTGAPKGVMLSHRNLLSNIYAVNSIMGLTSDDSILVVVPLNFIHGRMQLLTHAFIGGTMVFATGFHFPQQMVDALLRYEVTGFSGVPYHFSMLLERTNIVQTRLPSLRYVVLTGGAAMPTLLQKISQALPGTAIHIGYGQTEASPRISNLSPWTPWTAASLGHPVGVPIAGVRVDIVDERGASVAPGTVGEVVVSGPNIMCGYVSGDERTSGKIDEFGRLHTGDLGALDSQGYLFLAGRTSEMIKCAGERVYAGEVESVLYAHPAIRECAALGVPDDTLGERIVACVRVHPEMTVSGDDIRSHCLKFLPLVRVPREIRFTDALPKTGSGKVDRRGLLAEFQNLHQASQRRGS